MAVLVLSRGNFLVFISNENEMTMSSKGKIFDESCLSKMMILLMFVLCCYVVQVSVAVLVSSREDFLVFIWK